MTQQIFGIEKEKIEQKIHNIHNHLQSSNSNLLGLLSGNMGKIFFSFLYAIHFNDDNAYEKASEQLVALIKKIETATIGGTFCDGLAGIAWAINYLIKAQVIDCSKNLFTSLNESLYNVMIVEIARKNYDFLHGTIGIGLYFVSTGEKPSAISRLIASLKEDAIIDNQGCCKWRHYSSTEGLTARYNLGLSHGIPNIISLLSKIVKHDPANKDAKEMLVGATNYILTCRQSSEKYLSYFPTFGDEPSASRLGWCYGDIGVCIALLQAAETLSNTELKDFSLRVLDATTARRGIEEEHIKDAAICHGAAGLFYIYQKLFKTYGYSSFGDYAQYWLSDVFRKSFHEDGIAGYKAYRYLDGGEYSNEVGLLDGASGIGIVLLSLLSNEQEWDECFLLS